MVLVVGWEAVDGVLEEARARCCSGKSSLFLVCQVEGGLLAAGTCGSDEHFGVGLDDDVDWFLRFLIIVFSVTFSLLTVQTWRTQTTLEIFLTATARVLIFFVRL